MMLKRNERQEALKMRAHGRRRQEIQGCILDALRSTSGDAIELSAYGGDDQLNAHINSAQRSTIAHAFNAHACKLQALFTDATVG